MSFSDQQIADVMTWIAFKLNQAGIAYTGLRLLVPGQELAPEWDSDNVFDTQYTGWRINIDATLTEQQRATIATQVAALNVTDFNALVQAELAAVLAAMPVLMKQGSYAEWIAWWDAQPHSTAGERADRLEEAMLYTWQLLNALRNIAAAYLRAQKLREG